MAARETGSFATIRGQPTAVRLLRSTLRTGRVASGYLFSGPEGVGKGLTAKAFARAVLCPESPDLGDACGGCPSCVRSRAGSHPGLFDVRLLPGKTRIIIGQIHALSERLSLRPVEGDRSVAVIDGAERTNEESANALLKTLEEPPPGATLVLVTSRAQALPETIRSRCQAVRFQPLPLTVVADLLREGDDTVEAEEAEVLAAFSGGSIGLAREMRAANLGEALALMMGEEDGEASPGDRAGAVIAHLGRGEGANPARRLDLLLTMAFRVLSERVTREGVLARSLERRFARLVTISDRLRTNVGVESLLKAYFAARE